MSDNRPKSREKHVSGQAKDVYRRGEGLGTGPVGSGSLPRPSASGQTPSGGTRSRGGGRSPLFLILVVAVLYFVFRGSLGGDGGSLLSGSQSSGSESGYGSLYPAAATQSPSSSSGGSGAGSLIESLLGGAGSWTGGGSSTWSSSANTGTLNREVSPLARDKFTEIRGDGSDQVTVMVYMCGSDLESRSGMATRDLGEMSKATLSDKLNLVVCTGGCRQWQNSVIRSDVNQIYTFRDGSLVNTGKTLGSGSMTSPDTLSGFISYCVENYPATRYELIFWDHGGGSLSGYGYDERFARGGSLTLSAISEVLGASEVKFDFVGFDACLMATVENAAMLSEYADYLIASEETEPGIGWYYTNWLTALARDPSLPTLDLGKQIVDDFISNCNRQCAGQPTTLSVVDLAELAETLPKNMSAFASSLKDQITSGDYQSVSTARGNSREFASSSRIDQIDFVDFAERIGSNEAKNLAKVLRSAVKYNATASSITNAYGLSVYFPLKKLSSVDTAVKTYDALGMDEDYTACIRAFASLETSGQISSGGTSNSPYASLLGNFTNGYSGNSSAGMMDISSLLSAAMSGDLSGLLGAGGSFFSDRSMDELQQDAANLAGHLFDPSQLYWQENANGQLVLSMDEAQWALTQDLALNLFVDDGAGYIDLGLDNVFSFDDNGNLVPDLEGTWITINRQPVAYYYTGTAEQPDGSYTFMGYVPALLNGEAVRLMLIFNDEFPTGYVAGAMPVYEDGETDTVARGLIELQDGDMLDFLCDFYSYSGNYEDSYKLGDPLTVQGELSVSDASLSESLRILYRFTDVYGQHYWTEAIEK